MSRLVVISNRAPCADSMKDSGGLVVALKDTLKKHNGLWIGIEATTLTHVENELRPSSRSDFQIASLPITKQEQDNYYSGYSNSVLWPAFHNRLDLIDFHPDYLKHYILVAKRFAQAIKSHIAQDDIIWIHDYQLIPLAYCLRELGVNNTIGFFLHIPVPNVDILMSIPGYQHLTEWFTAYDLIGLQTKKDILHLNQFISHILQNISIFDNIIQHKGRHTQIGHFPISINTQEFHERAKFHEDDANPRLRRIIGVDRLDYSKGLYERFKAFELFLAQNSEYHNKVSFLQIAPPTRGDIPAYQAIRTQIQNLFGKINSHYSDIGYMPVNLIHRAIDRDRLAGLHRNAQVAMVTPLADGMNLVAKEFLAAQDEYNPGVLILSQFAGAAEELKEAIIVNPHDIYHVAAAIKQSLDMPKSERIDRHARLIKTLYENDIDHWSDNYMTELHHINSLKNMGFLPQSSACKAYLEAVA